MAAASALRTRNTAPKVFDRERRWAISRSVSSVCFFFCSGYFSGSAAPCTVTARALSSTAWPLPGDATSSPSTLMQAPVVMAATTSGDTTPASSTTCRSAGDEPSLS